MRSQQNKRARLRRRRNDARRPIVQPKQAQFAGQAVGILSKLAEPFIPKKPWIGLLAEQKP
jgi:hypothetical protein